MADEPFSPNGEPQRPALPWILFAISNVVAVLATAGFVYLITNRTTGPVEVLRDFYEARADGNCEDTYALFSEDLQAARSEADWCEELQSAGGFPRTFEVVEVVLEDDIATVTVEEDSDGLGSSRLAWRLQRDGRTWRITDRVSPGAGVGPETPAS